MNLIILAAGRNSRLDQGFPKCLLKLNNETLLERHLRLFYKIGVRSVCVVTGFRSEMIESAVAGFQIPEDLQVDLVFNPKFDLENGYSLFCASSWIHGRNEFLLTMSDHIFNEPFLRNFTLVPAGAKSLITLACDIPGESNDHIDFDDVTKVQADEVGHILDIGKSITDFNLYDTGLFKMSGEVCNLMEACFERKEFTLSHIVKEAANRHQATVWINDNLGFWKDIDTPQDLEQAKTLQARL